MICVSKCEFCKNKIQNTDDGHTHCKFYIDGIPDEPEKLEKCVFDETTFFGISWNNGIPKPLNDKKEDRGVICKIKIDDK
mgnify:CR=1 FL=1